MAIINSVRPATYPHLIVKAELFVFWRSIYTEYITIGICFVLYLASFAQAATYSGGAGTEDDPYVIATAEDLNSIGANSSDWGKCFKLTADLDMSAYTGTQYNIIGSPTRKFTGTFDGDGHVIRDLTYSTDADLYYVGLFGYTSNAQIQNLSLENVSIVSNGWYIGGLVGYNSGTITDCYVTGSVSGKNNVGGVAGYNSNGTVAVCYATGSVAGTAFVGNLVGYNLSGTIDSCYATGSVNGKVSIGGLAGYNSYGTITSCYASGPVSGSSNYAGGLIGVNNGTVTTCSATGSISESGNYVGGLIGYNSAEVTVCYSTGSVSGTGTYVGGLTGYNVGSLTACFWNIQTSGQTTSSGGTGITADEMMMLSTFTSAGWDFSATDGDPADWWMPSDDYPQLASDAAPSGSLKMRSSSYTVAEDAGSVRLYVSRTGGASGSASVNYTTADGSAAAGSDYTSITGTLTWSDGESSDKYIDVAITNDSESEADETFTVTLSGASGAILGSPQQTTVTIPMNDQSSGSVQFGASIYTAVETVGSVRLYVSRTGGASGSASVNYATADGSAVAGSDYTAITGTLTWSDGESSDKYIDVAITNDSESEADETFTVTLSGAGGAILGSPQQTTVTIPMNDQSSGSMQFGASTYTAVETVGSVRLYVSRTGGASGSASVNYATADGSAAAGLDYTAINGTLSWSDGESSEKYIDVAITNDSASETDETFTVTLSGAGGAILGSPQQTTVTIPLNDQLPGSVQFGASTYIVTEDAGSVRVYVSRTGGASGSASVNYATADGSAAAGSDYTSINGTLSWSDGESSEKYIDVAITNDSESENDETFTVTLSGAGGAILGSPQQTTVTIPVNDQSSGSVQFGASTYTAVETAGSVRLYVSRTGGASGSASVNYATADGSATAGLDYTAINGTLTWSDGESSEKYIDVAITNDSLSENDETFTVTLSGAGGAILGSPQQTTVTIWRNDQSGRKEIKFYKVNLPTLFELDFLKAIMPQYKSRFTETAEAVESGQEFEYGIMIDNGYVENSARIRSIELRKPDTTSVPFVFEDDSFKLQAWYFTFDEFYEAFPEGDYTIHTVYNDASTEDQVLAVPAYAAEDFIERVDGELVWDNDILILNWTPVDGDDIFYDGVVNDLKKEIEIWSNGIQPEDTRLDFDLLISKGNYDCRVEVEASKLLRDQGNDIWLISGSRWWNFKDTVPVYEAKATRCTVASGADNLGSISLAGQLEAVETDFLNADTAIITLNAEAMPSPLTFTFPVTDITFENGRYNYNQTVNGSPLVFKYDTKTRVFIFSARKIDLTGMACPIRVDITIGDHSSTLVNLDETLVNGPRKSCPPQLMMGVQDCLDITRSVFRAGKKPDSDTLSVQGWFTVNGNLDINEPFIAVLGGQMFTVPGGLFTYRNGIYRCTNVPANEGGIVSVKLDTNRCLFTLSIKRATFENYDIAEFDLSILGCPLVGLEQIDLGTAHNYWQLTQHDQGGAAWLYNSKRGVDTAEIRVVEQGSDNFQVYEDDAERDIALLYTKGADNSVSLSHIVLDSDRLGGAVELNVDLGTWPSFLRPGQIYSSISEVTGNMVVSGQDVEIVDGTLSATSTIFSYLMKVRVPAGTYSTVRFNENWTIKGDLQRSGEHFGTITIIVKRTNYALPNYGVVKRIHNASIIVRVLNGAALIDKSANTYSLTRE